MTPDPRTQRETRGTRYHHFVDLTGRLVGTIVSEPYDNKAAAIDGRDYVAVAAAIVSKKDTPNRARGRAISYGRLTAGEFLVMSLDALKAAITNRTILQHFSGGARLKLRPRAPFTPRVRE